jgi:hypothetical protein
MTAVHSDICGAKSTAGYFPGFPFYVFGIPSKQCVKCSAELPFGRLATYRRTGVWRYRYLSILMGFFCFCVGKLFF